MQKPFECKTRFAHGHCMWYYHFSVKVLQNQSCNIFLRCEWYFENDLTCQKSEFGLFQLDKGYTNRMVTHWFHTFIVCVCVCRICTTLRLLSSFPARAKSKVVFPDPGGPNSNVILQTTHNILSFIFITMQTYMKLEFLHLKIYYKTLLIKTVYASYIIILIDSIH